MNKRRTGALTIQGIKERFPWITLPFCVMSSLITPQRWACGVDRAAASIIGAPAFDTTRLARFLIRCFAMVARARVFRLSESESVRQRY